MIGQERAEQVEQLSRGTVSTLRLAAGGWATRHLLIRGHHAGLLISTSPRTWEWDPRIMLTPQYQAMHQYGTRPAHLHVLLYLEPPLEWALSLTENALCIRCNSTEPIRVNYYTTFTYPYLIIITALSIGAGSFYQGYTLIGSLPTLFTIQAILSCNTDTCSYHSY